MIEIGKKYGCLTVLGMASDSLQSKEYLEYKEELEQLKEQQRICKDYSSEYYEWLQIKIYRLTGAIHGIESDDHYKCQCKCGKIQYYDATTIEKKLTYCCHPIALSRDRSRIRSKLAKYSDNESVELVYREYCRQFSEYCGIYNDELAEKHGARNAERLAKLASMPRVYAENYDVDFTGRHFGILHIEERMNDCEETRIGYLKNAGWHNYISVDRQYRCKCTLCGEEQTVKGSDFAIYRQGTWGYQGKVYCECHYMTSFEWITCKLLFENNIPFQAEYSFPDLLGFSEKHPLRYDFAVFNADGSIRCLIECDGPHHKKPIHGEIDFIIGQEYDKLKDEYAMNHNIQLIRIESKHNQYENVEKTLKENGII